MLGLVLTAAAALATAQQPACHLMKAQRPVELAVSGGFGAACAYNASAMARVCVPQGAAMRRTGVDIGRQSNIHARPATVAHTSNCVVSGVAGAPADRKGFYPLYVCGRAKAEATVWVEYCR